MTIFLKTWTPSWSIWISLMGKDPAGETISWNSKSSLTWINSLKKSHKKTFSKQTKHFIFTLISTCSTDSKEFWKALTRAIIYQITRLTLAVRKNSKSRWRLIRLTVARSNWILTSVWTTWISQKFLKTPQLMLAINARALKRPKNAMRLSSCLQFWLFAFKGSRTESKTQKS